MGDKIEWGGTPGPWRLNAGNTFAIMSGSKQIANTVCGGMTGVSMADAEANARAIVEVPAMVAFIRELLVTMRADYCPQGWEPLRDGARAILSRIDGGQIDG